MADNSKAIPETTNRFQFEGDVTVPQCQSCAHWHEDLTCDAYPDGIPMGILSNEIDHQKPFKGDHGIQWSPVAVVHVNAQKRLDGL